jgi:hypothetical protein
MGVSSSVLNEQEEEDYLEECSQDDANVSFNCTIVFSGSPNSIQEVEEEVFFKKFFFAEKKKTCFDFFTLFCICVYAFLL